MKRSKNEKTGFTFSFLDVLFLLLLGLIFSVILYFVLETPAFLGEEKEYRVELSAYLDSGLASALPQKSEILYDEAGQEVGKILSVESEVRGNSVFCKMICTATGSDFKVGEKMQVETKNFICDMWIYSAEEMKGGQK